jgi:non-specific serine/threonine protein kinase
MPLAELAGLAREAQLQAGVTIDFAGAGGQGQPLVVLRVPTGNRPARCLSVLSPREREVAALVAEGLSNKQIARRLSITVATVKDHVHRILSKASLANRAAIAAAWQGRGHAQGEQPVLGRR